MPEKKTSKKSGKKSSKCTAYKGAFTREKNKLKRIRQSNGWNFAAAYAKAKGLLGWYKATYPRPSADYFQTDGAWERFKFYEAN